MRALGTNPDWPPAPPEDFGSLDMDGLKGTNGFMCKRIEDMILELWNLGVIRFRPRSPFDSDESYIDDNVAAVMNLYTGLDDVEDSEEDSEEDPDENRDAWEDHEEDRHEDPDENRDAWEDWAWDEAASENGENVPKAEPETEAEPDRPEEVEPDVEDYLPIPPLWELPFKTRQAIINQMTRSPVVN